MSTHLTSMILNSPKRLAVPIGAYAGLPLTGATVYDVVTNPRAQAEVQQAFSERFHPPFLLTAMDLSAEAQAFGGQVVMSGNEVPTIVGRRITNLEQVQALTCPQPGDARTAVHLEAARLLAALPNGQPVVGGIIGPFSLAGRLFGVSEALEMTMSEPETVHALLQKVTQFLIAYAHEFHRAGAAGVIMAEPAAGLLSPRALAAFSSVYVRQIIDAVQVPDFTVILHNCGARLVHLSRILESGAEIYHFGAPMDLPAALGQVDDAVILAGNLDPSAVFFGGDPGLVCSKTHELLAAVAGRRNFVLSSGCDLPPGTPLENLEAFYAAMEA
ncbi:MAG TPA: uroporphyrinogen decarboxylase family protein [Anaerolineaceae bacterium]|nr:uroporphyrinogen decarboxylase family protein [Anaerolineaceae bacterium]